MLLTNTAPKEYSFDTIQAVHRTMNRSLNDVYAAIAKAASDSREESRLRNAARRYHQECGCRLSGIFLICAIVSAATYLALASPFRWSGIPVAIAIIFTAGLAGKAIGIAWARIRLSFLHRSLVRRTVGAMRSASCPHAPNG